MSITMKGNTAAWSLFFLLLMMDISYAFQTKIKVGETITIEGVFIIADGEDIQEKPVKYPCIRLEQAIYILYKDDEDLKVKSLMLWLDKKQEAVFHRLIDKRVRVTGKIYYYWYGPSTMPNPVKLEVVKIEER